MKRLFKSMTINKIVILALAGPMLSSSLSLACNPNEDCMRRVCYIFACSMIEDQFCAIAKSSCRAADCGRIDADVTLHIEKINSKINHIDEELSTLRTTQANILSLLNQSEYSIQSQNQLCQDLEISQSSFMNNQESQRSLVLSLELLISSSDLNTVNLFEALKKNPSISDRNKNFLENFIHQAIDSNLSISKVINDFKNNNFDSFEKILSAALVKSQKMADRGNLIGEKNGQASRLCK